MKVSFQTGLVIFKPYLMQYTAMGKFRKDPKLAGTAKFEYGQTNN
jgi:hypothetical protein